MQSFRRRQTFTTCLTDGTEVELFPGGRVARVTHARRAEYRALATAARLREAEAALERMRAGLASVVPEPLLALLSWGDLERLACGSPEVDVALLRRHTRCAWGVVGGCVRARLAGLPDALGGKREARSP